MLACCALALALTATAASVPDLLGVGLLLPDNRDVVIWTARSRTLVASGALLWALSCGFAWRGWKRRPRAGGADGVLAPLTLLPFSLAGFFLRPHLPQAAAASLLFFLPLLLAATSLLRLLRGIDARGRGAAPSARGAWVVGAGFWVSAALTGWYFTSTMIKPPGDTGHYLVIAESLYRDHDLDLRNNLGVRAEQDPKFWHISPFSLEGRLYSWHSFGLSLLLAPLVPGGPPARHLLLGLFAGLCCAGIWELCRRFGATRHWSLTAFLLFALSRYWGIYASLTLPEVAGAALTTWAAVAILRQADRPGWSATVLVACCASLPWLHTRFIPVSGALAGIYVLAGLLQPGPRRAALPRLAAVSAACGAAFAGFFAYHLTLFTGGLPLPTGLFFAYPLGMWFGVAHRKGLLSVLPLFAGMVAAAAWVLVRDAANRQGAALVLLLTGVVLVTSLTAPFWAGGDSYPGRYLVVVAPLFVPLLAGALGLLSPVAQWWVIFLGLIPCAQFALVLLGLPELGDLSLIYDRLNGLVEYVAPDDASTLQPVSFALIVGTLLLFLLDPSRRRLAQCLAAAMLIVAGAGGDHRPGGRLLKFREVSNARRLAGLGAHLEDARVLARGGRSALDLFQASDLFRRHKFPASIGPGAAPAAGDDRAGRGYRWVPLVPAFDAGAGWRACRLKGRLAGGATAHWVVREGADTLFEGPLAAGPDGAVEVTATFPCRGHAPIEIAVRFEADRGSLLNPGVAWSPFSPQLLATAGFRL